MAQSNIVRGGVEWPGFIVSFWTRHSLDHQLNVPCSPVHVLGREFKLQLLLLLLPMNIIPLVYLRWVVMQRPSETVGSSDKQEER